MKKCWKPVLLQFGNSAFRLRLDSRVSMLFSLKVKR